MDDAEGTLRWWAGGQSAGPSIPVAVVSVVPNRMTVRYLHDSREHLATLTVREGDRWVEACLGSGPLIEGVATVRVDGFQVVVTHDVESVQRRADGVVRVEFRLPWLYDWSRRGLRTVLLDGLLGMPGMARDELKRRGITRAFLLEGTGIDREQLWWTDGGT
jgi:hypothetical protein